MRRALLIFEKDIRIELAGMQVVPVVAILALLIVLIFGFALGQSLAGTAEAAAILSIAVLFSGLVAVEKCFDSESHNDALAGLRSAAGPSGDVSFIFWGKVLWILLLLCAVEIWVCLVFGVLFNFDLLLNYVSLIIIFALFNAGFAGIGVLFAALTSMCRGKGFLLVILLLPLLIPPVIGMVNSLKIVFDGAGLGQIGNWLKFLAGFDLVFLSLSRILFDKVLD
jgi:heme exporter protein B